MTDTIQWSEIIWVAVVIPGIYFWTKNLSVALTEHRAVKWTNAGRAEQIFSRDQVETTVIAVVIEVVFLVIGLLSMLTVPNPNSSDAFRYLFTMLITLTSMAISFKAFRWRVANIEVRKALENGDEDAH